MARQKGDILIIDDDPDEVLILELVFDQLGVQSRRRYFDSPFSVLEQLGEHPDLPFMILCDINMPLMNGWELRRELEQRIGPRIRTIPFVFFSTAFEAPAASDDQFINQGYFIKPTSVQEYTQLLQLLVQYWNCSQLPAVQD